MYVYIPGTYSYINIYAKYIPSMHRYILSTYQYIHGVPHRWTAAELKKVIAMLQNPEIDTKDIDPDLHQQMAKAVDDGQVWQEQEFVFPCWLWQTQLRRMAGVAATSMRLTSGCGTGSLDVSSLA